MQDFQNMDVRMKKHIVRIVNDEALMQTLNQGKHRAAAKLTALSACVSIESRPGSAEMESPCRQKNTGVCRSDKGNSEKVS